MRGRLGQRAVAAALVMAAVAVLAPPGAQATASSNTITGWVSALPGPTASASPQDSAFSTVSGNGRYVVFLAQDSFSPLDTNGSDDIYVRDLLTDRVELISVSADGKAAAGARFSGGISDDGRYVAYASSATNVVTPDANGAVEDIFVRDRTLGTTILASKNSSGTQLSTDVPAFFTMKISGNGRYVVFNSKAPELLSPASNILHIYVRDLQLGFTERVSVSSTSVLANNNSVNADISADGRWVAFATLAYNLGGDTNGTYRDVYVHDRTLHITSIASLTDGDAQVGSHDVDWPSISNDGQKVAFISDGVMTPTGDTTAVTDVFVRNRATASTTKVSTRLGGGEADQDAGIPEISGDGTTVAWPSDSGEYIAGGGNGEYHMFKRVGAGPITRESVSSTGVMGNASSYDPSLSTDGTVLTYTSSATNLATGDAGSNLDVYVRRRPEVGPHGTTAAYATAMAAGFGASAAAATAMTAHIAAGSSPEREALLLAEAPAFASKRGPLVRLYSAYFKRLPDTAGLAYWLGKYTGGMKLDDISAKFAASSEFQNKYGNTTNAQFVTLVYNNVMGRDPDAGGLSFWVTKLNAGMSRGTVMTNFSESSEGTRKFRPYVDTALVSLGLLGQIAPAKLVNAVLDYMKLDSPERGLQRLVVSPEYAAAAAG